MTMTVRDLIYTLLVECGHQKRACQINSELEDNELAEAPVGIDPPLNVDHYNDHVRYIKSIDNEGTFVMLRVED